MTYAIVLSAARAFLNGGANFHAQMNGHANRKGHVPADLINKLARLVEKRYVCEATITDYGWQFKCEDGARHAAASQFWSRNVRPYDATPMSARGGATSAQADAVSKLVAAYGRLSAAERRRFLKSI
jgi:hypothetical protein